MISHMGRFYEKLIYMMLCTSKLKKKITYDVIYDLIPRKYDIISHMDKFQ